jgi:hypothetical protein
MSDYDVDGFIVGIVSDPQTAREAITLPAVLDTRRVPYQGPQPRRSNVWPAPLATTPIEGESA